MTILTHPNAIQRQELLAALYTAREQNPANGWVNEKKLAPPPVPGGPPGLQPGVAFALDVLAELGHIKRNGFDLRITGAGVLACEQAQG